MRIREGNVAAYKYLEQGNYSGSLTGKRHSGVPFDQVIEITSNRLCKDIGGLWGNTKFLCEGKVHHCIVALREHLNKKIKKKTTK